MQYRMVTKTLKQTACITVINTVSVWLNPKSAIINAQFSLELESRNAFSTIFCLWRQCFLQWKHPVALCVTQLFIFPAKHSRG